MDYPWAVPGAKVVCVDDSGKTSVVRGKKYTILSLAPDTDDDVKVGVELEEVVPIIHPRFFLIERFRLLITKTQEQDIEMFRKIVNQEPVTA